MEAPDRGRGFFNETLETLVPEARWTRLSGKLAGMVTHAYEHCSAVKEIFEQAQVAPEEIRTLDDLEKIPLTRKEDLVAKQKEHTPFGGFATTAATEAGRIYINPGLIFQPGEGDYDAATWAEALVACGMRRGDIVQNTFNYHLWPFAFTLDESLRRLGVTVVPTGVGNTMMQINIMRIVKVNGFVGTPSFLMTLADRAETMGLDLAHDLMLEVGFVSAEMVPEGLRSRLEERLGMVVRQGYGTVFTGCLGYECPERNGLHIPQDVIVEIVDPHSGRRVAPETTGEIVATTFNPVFPMIRFATGDLSALTEAPCPCGRTSYRLKRILGRVDQATKVKGTFIHPWQTDEVAAQFPEIFKYQVVVTREEYTDAMVFVAEVRDDSIDRELLRRRLAKSIKETLTVKGKVEVVPPGTIPDWHQKIVDRRQW
jgi:phenylacetate-CoA ligase